MLLDTTSLAVTIDRCNERLFWGRDIAEEDRAAVCDWIARRQGLHGSYWGMFAPTDFDFSRPLTLFTGEKITTNAGRSHILGEEASVVLRRLGQSDPAVMEAVAKADDGLGEATARYYGMKPEAVGHYCCGTCTPAFWRNLRYGGLGGKEEWLSAGIRMLKGMRTPDHEWRRFSLPWTVYSLLDIDLPEAKQELEWVAPKLDNIAKRKGSGVWGERWREVAIRALGRI